MTMREVKCEVIAKWADELGWPFVLPRRAWKRFRQHAGFACSQGGGFSGAAKLAVAYHALRRRRAAGELERWLPRTVGDLLTVAAARGEPLGFLPPVQVYERVRRLVGRRTK